MLVDCDNWDLESGMNQERVRILSRKTKSSGWRGLVLGKEKGYKDARIHEDKDMTMDDCKDMYEVGWDGSRGGWDDYRIVLNETF